MKTIKRFAFIAVGALLALVAYFAAYWLVVPQLVRSSTQGTTRVGDAFNAELAKHVKAGNELKIARARLVALGFPNFCTKVTPCEPGYYYHRYRVPVVFWPLAPVNSWMIEIRADDGARVLEVRGMIAKDGYL